MKAIVVVEETLTKKRIMLEVNTEYLKNSYPRWQRAELLIVLDVISYSLFILLV